MRVPVCTDISADSTGWLVLGMLKLADSEECISRGRWDCRFGLSLSESHFIISSFSMFNIGLDLRLVGLLVEKAEHRSNGWTCLLAMEPVIFPNANVIRDYVYRWCFGSGVTQLMDIPPWKKMCSWLADLQSKIFYSIFVWFQRSSLVILILSYYFIVHWDHKIP